jgi:DNA-binding MarR family transcriptional regulator
VTATASEPGVVDALRAYLAGVALMEPVQARLWQDAGLTLTQLLVLRKLRAGPHPAGKVARALGVSAASASRILDRLEERGLIDRRRNPADRRCVEIHLLPEGHRLVGERLILRDSGLEDAVRSMTPAERRRLAASLRLLVDRVREHDPAKEPALR